MYVSWLQQRSQRAATMWWSHRHHTGEKATGISVDDKKQSRAKSASCRHSWSSTGSTFHGKRKGDGEKRLWLRYNVWPAPEPRTTATARPPRRSSDWRSRPRRLFDTRSSLASSPLRLKVPRECTDHNGSSPLLPFSGSPVLAVLPARTVWCLVGIHATRSVLTQAFRGERRHLRYVLGLRPGLQVDEGD